MSFSRPRKAAKQAATKPSRKRHRKKRVIPEFVREAPQRHVRAERGTKDGLQEEQITEKISDREAIRGNRQAQIAERVRVNARGGEQRTSGYIPERTEQKPWN